TVGGLEDTEAPPRGPQTESGVASVRRGATEQMQRHVNFARSGVHHVRIPRIDGERAECQGSCDIASATPRGPRIVRDPESAACGRRADRLWIVRPHNESPEPPGEMDRAERREAVESLAV